MEEKQIINCTVESCKYNKNEEQLCSLRQIEVTPIENCNTMKPDESQCSSYENINK